MNNTRGATLLLLWTRAALAIAGVPASCAAPGSDSGGVSLSEACVWEDFDAAVERFSRVLQFETVSDVSAPNHAARPEEFARLDAFLRAAYPRVFGALTVEKTGADALSYLLTWTGSDPALRPVLLVSHTDVVPVTPESIKDWTHPPFSGAVADGFIWGRGAMDVKVTVVAILEAAEALLGRGWWPTRTLLFAFGHDEEVGGAMGAVETARLLESRGVQLEVIWDEGSGILLDGVKPFMDIPVALVGTAEKGYQSAKLHVTSTGGHSSMPPIDGSSVGAVVGRLLTRLSASPPPPRLVSPVTDMLRGLAPYAPAWMAAVLSAVGRVPGVDALVARLMASASAEAAALTRTTAAVTRLSAGVADNVLPQSATIGVNLRTLPGDGPGEVLDYLTGVVGPRDAGRVEIELVTAAASPPTKVTPTDGHYFTALKAVIQEVWRCGDKPLPVLPFLLPGLTDSRHYERLSANGALKWLPTAMSRAHDLRRVHGTDERSSLLNLRGAMCTAARVMQALCGAEGAAAAGGGGGQHSEL